MHSRLGSSPCISNIAEMSRYKIKFPSATLIQTFTKLLMKSWMKTAGEGHYSSESVFTGYTVLKSLLIRGLLVASGEMAASRNTESKEHRL